MKKVVSLVIFVGFWRSICFLWARHNSGTRHVKSRAVPHATCRAEKNPAREKPIRKTSKKIF